DTAVLVGHVEPVADLHALVATDANRRAPAAAGQLVEQVDAADLADLLLRTTRDLLGLEARDARDPHLRVVEVACRAHADAELVLALRDVVAVEHAAALKARRAVARSPGHAARVGDRAQELGHATA